MATRFWVGGTGTWDASSTAHWAATSGGSSGASVPGSGDTVEFDSNSGSGAVVTLSTSPTVVSITRTGTTALTLTLGSNTITCNLAGTAWSFASVANLTMTANTATVTLTGTAAVFSAAAKDWNGMSLSFTGSGTPAMSGNGGTFRNLTRTGTAVKTDGFTISTTAATITGTATFTGNSPTNRLTVFAGVNGTTRSLILTGGHIANTNVCFRDIVVTGSPTVDTTSSVDDAGGNSGITFTTPTTVTASAAGNWSAGATWVGGVVPLCHDTVVLDGSAGAGTYTVDMPRLCKDLVCTGFTRTLAISNNAEVYGSITAGSGMTISGTSQISLMGRSSHTITSATKTWTCSFRLGGALGGNATGTYTLADAFTSSSSVGTALTINDRTFNDGGFAVNFTNSAAAILVQSASSGLTMTGTWTFNTTGAVTFWAYSAGTITASTSTIVLANVSANTRTFQGGGKTYGTLTYTVAGSTGQLTITGFNSFLDINFSDVTNARTLVMPGLGTTTIRGNFNVNGTSGKLMTVQSGTAGNTATLSKASGTVVCAYLSLKDSAATGGAAFYAGRTSTNVSGNSGWNFVDFVVSTMAATLGGLSGAEAATVTVPATLASSLGQLGGAASATIKEPATLAVAAGTLTATISATVSVPASLAGALGPLAAAAAGTVTTPGVSGTMAASLGQLVAAGLAVVKEPAALSAPLGQLVVALSATIKEPAALSSSLGPLVASAAVVTVRLVLAASLGRLEAAASGALTVPAGGLAASLGALEAEVSATVVVHVVADATLGQLDAAMLALPVHGAFFDAPLGELTSGMTGTTHVPAGLIFGAIHAIRIYMGAMLADKVCAGDVTVWRA